MYGGHWFDSENAADRDILLDWFRRSNDNAKSAYTKAMYIWTITDLIKREFSRRNRLNYLVFWETDRNDDHKPYVLDDMPDLYMWLYEYDANYETFIKDHPENTY